MAHQSGIRASAELANTFKEAVENGNTRIIKVSIVNESLVSTQTIPVSSTFEKDFEQAHKLLDQETPCYLLVRMDSKSSNNDWEWLFACYVSDFAKVRDKMLYASSQATLKKELGDYRFVHNMYGTIPDEFTFSAYKKHLAHVSAAGPLTDREKQLEELKKVEMMTDISISSRISNLPAVASSGVSFPIDVKVKEELSKVKSKQVGAVLLGIKNETIVHIKSLPANTQVDSLSSEIPTDQPSFTLLHMSNEKSKKSAFVFIFHCPETAKVKDRMIYSSSRGGLMAFIEGKDTMGIDIGKKIESSSTNDIPTVDDLTLELFSSPADNGTNGAASSTSENGTGFKKPSGPGRGPRRIVKT